MYNVPSWSIERLVCVTCDPFMAHTHVLVLVNAHGHSHTSKVIHPSEMGD